MAPRRRDRAETASSKPKSPASRESRRLEAQRQRKRHFARDLTRRLDDNGIRKAVVSISIAAERIAPFHQGRRTQARPPISTVMIAQGASFWPLQVGRAILAMRSLHIAQSTNSKPPRERCSSRMAERAGVRPHAFLENKQGNGWSTNRQYWKRVLQAHRRHLGARCGTLVERVPDSSARWAEIVFAADRSTC